MARSNCRVATPNFCVRLSTAVGPCGAARVRRCAGSTGCDGRAPARSAVRVAPPPRRRRCRSSAPQLLDPPVVGLDQARRGRRRCCGRRRSACGSPWYRPTSRCRRHTRSTLRASHRPATSVSGALTSRLGTLRRRTSRPGSPSATRTARPHAGQRLAQRHRAARSAPARTARRAGPVRPTGRPALASTQLPRPRRPPPRGPVIASEPWTSSPRSHQVSARIDHAGARAAAVEPRRAPRARGARRPRLASPCRTTSARDVASEAARSMLLVERSSVAEFDGLVKYEKARTAGMPRWRPRARAGVASRPSADLRVERVRSRRPSSLGRTPTTRARGRC